MTAGVILFSFYEVSIIIIRIVMLCYIPQHHSPTTAMSWLLSIYLMPWPGFLLYAAFGSTALPGRGPAAQTILKALESDKAAFRRIT